LDNFPACLLQLTQLRVLRLTGNAIARLPSDLDALARLEDLALDNNRITEIPSTISALTALRKLQLRCVDVYSGMNVPCVRACADKPKV
jgi:Leucine-rich repeat (LRR) protein